MMAPRVIYAANRAIGARVLSRLLEAGIRPVALLLPPDGDRNAEMIGMAPGVAVWTSPDRRAFESVRPDYLLSVHYPVILPLAVLEVPSVGCLNLHPAYLPYNRGWHTPSWAIIDGTPAGATLHWMGSEVDAGDIAVQERVEVRPEDTTHSLYQRILAAGEAVMERAIPMMQAGSVPRVPQGASATGHRKCDLGRVARLDLDAVCRVGDIVDRIRALTTNDPEESAWFEAGGVRYGVRLDIHRR